MTIYAPGSAERRLEEFAERAREAWREYRESVRGLDGRRYEVAEAEAWDILQQELGELAAERVHLGMDLRPPRT